MKLILDKCEIEGCEITDCLEKHHIIPRCDLNTTNNTFNIAILCPYHHALIGTRLKIIGIYPSTTPPNGRLLVYELDGKKNIDIDQPFIEFHPKSFKINKEKDE